jgi:hypothetical protein
MIWTGALPAWRCRFDPPTPSSRYKYEVPTINTYKVFPSLPTFILQTTFLWPCPAFLTPLLPLVRFKPSDSDKLYSLQLLWTTEYSTRRSATPKALIVVIHRGGGNGSCNPVSQPDTRPLLCLSSIIPQTTVTEGLIRLRFTVLGALDCQQGRQLCGTEKSAGAKPLSSGQAVWPLQR